MKSLSLYIYDLEGREKFGKKHPHTFLTLHNLALLYVDEGKINEAISF